MKTEHLRRPTNATRPEQMARPSADRLPPNSGEAERAVLGCVLLNPEQLAAVNEAFGAEQPFYDLRHDCIFTAMRGLHAEGKPIDLVMLVQRLKDMGNLEGSGGPAYISTLPDEVPSGTMLRYYLDIVLEKHALRKTIQASFDLVGKAYNLEGAFDGLLVEWETRLLAVKALQRREEKRPELLKKPQEFGEAVFNKFFGLQGDVEPGLDLPIDFKLKARLGDMTLVSGDNGCGKSTLLSYFLIHLASQGQKVVLASLEEKPENALWGMCSQLLGASRFPDTPVMHQRVTRGIGWLNQRAWVFDFQGIADWREILAAFRWAARSLGATIFVLDNVMRIGIADDDMGTQGLAAAQFAALTLQENIHLFLVLHENKAGEGKNKVRGNKLWTDNAANWFRVVRNVKKAERMGEIEGDIITEKNSKTPNAKTIADLERELEQWKEKWDTGVLLGKQREKRTRQNSSRYFWYCPESFQFRVHREEAPINWLERWMRREKRSTTENTENTEKTL